MMKSRCGLEDCDCGHTIEKLEARLDCGKDADCADVVETQEQCKKHYELYVERELAGARDGLAIAKTAMRALEARHLLERDLFKPKPHWLPAKIWFQWRDASNEALTLVLIDWEDWLAT